MRDAEAAAFAKQAEKLRRKRGASMLRHWDLEPRGTPLTTEWYVAEVEADEKRIKGVLKEFAVKGGRKGDQAAVAKLVKRSLRSVREEKKEVVLLQRAIAQHGKRRDESVLCDCISYKRYAM